MDALIHREGDRLIIEAAPNKPAIGTMASLAQALREMATEGPIEDRVSRCRRRLVTFRSRRLGATAVTPPPLYLLNTNIISHAMRNPTGAVVQRVFAAETHGADDGACTSLIVQCERQGVPIGPNDTLIAAAALALGATLITADVEFTHVPGLQIENWLQPL